MSDTHISSQAFLEDPNKPGKFTEALDPVCSTNIFDAKVSKTVDLKLSLNFALSQNVSYKPKYTRRTQLSSDIWSCLPVLHKPAWSEDCRECLMDYDFSRRGSVWRSWTSATSRRPRREARRSSCSVRRCPERTSRYKFWLLIGWYRSHDMNTDLLIG